MYTKRAALLVTICFIAFTAVAQKQLPVIKENAQGVKQLYIDGEPFILLSGELHNSTSSDLDFLAPRMQDLKERGLNSVIATVSWELFEPQEGVYDTKLVKGIIDIARENNMKLVLIWFGTWKNSWSSYAPEWVKRDLKRFPRMQFEKGKNSGSLSALYEASWKADAKAFAELMKFIREYDTNEQTVIMMQVENETGYLGTSRDRSAKAEKLFHSPVPDQLLKYISDNRKKLTEELSDMLDKAENKSHSWEGMFGYGADEVFSAWHIASYVEKVVEAGKKEYNLPMYVNAWLDGSFSQDLKPNYPSGGPVSKMLNIWRAAAPSVDLIAPDIYVDDFKRVCRQYTILDNPLFIPELAPDIRQAAQIYYAIGNHQAICFAPFAIDGFKKEEAEQLAKVYHTLKEFLPLYAQKCSADNSIGFCFTNQDREQFTLGNYSIEVVYKQQRDKENAIAESAGMIFQIAENEFYILGHNIEVFFSAKNGGNAEFLSHDEGRFVDGKWIPRRRMNGDELEIRIKEPDIRKVKFHIYD